MIGIVMATMLEAVSFIKTLELLKQSDTPFPIYNNDKVRLIIGGIGKTNSAMATAHFIEKYRPICICNTGAAGSTNNEYVLGETYHIKKIIEPDRPDLKTGIPCEQIPHILSGFPLAVLSTRDAPVHDIEDRANISKMAGLADMEGAAVNQVCSHFKTRCFLFKFVSDTPEHMSNREIIRNIKLYSNTFSEFFCISVMPRLLESASCEL
ncbi:MAG TPA: hypothetical protein PLA06_08535 [Syntrophorhabdaceae bacterium]|nr:hypothetical protein [Syntrophorhabdaceae bacterium]